MVFARPRAFLISNVVRVVVVTLLSFLLLIFVDAVSLLVFRLGWMHGFRSDQAETLGQGKRKVKYIDRKCSPRVRVPFCVPFFFSAITDLVARETNSGNLK